MNSEKSTNLPENSKPASRKGMDLLYERYTTNSALANVNPDKTLEWSKRYFKANFTAHLPVDRSAKILEIGCGYGKNLLALNELGYTDIHGIDLSAEQVAYARKELGLDYVELADALAWLQQAEGRFDCILLIDVLEHLDLDTLMTLGQLMHQKLAVGGTIIVQVPNDLSPFNPFRQGDLTHVRAFTPQSLQQFFSSVDFDMQGIYSSLPAWRGFGVIRRILWYFVFNPVFSLLFLLLHGRATFTTVFTANVIAVARKG